MITSPERRRRAIVYSDLSRRLVTGAVSLGVLVGMFDAAATPTFAFGPSATARIDVVADDPDTPAPIDVVVPPDQTPVQPTADGDGPQAVVAPVDPCVPPYDRPELACTLAGGAITSGFVSATTGMSVYRYYAALPGTVIRAVLSQAQAKVALFLVGPGDQVLAHANSDGTDASRNVVATVVTPGTQAIYVVADPLTGDLSYSLQLVVEPPVANTDVPQLHGFDSPTQALADQCPQARSDTLVDDITGIFMLPKEPGNGGGAEPIHPSIGVIHTPVPNVSVTPVPSKFGTTSSSLTSSLPNLAQPGASAGTSSTSAAPSVSQSESPPPQASAGASNTQPASAGSSNAQPAPVSSTNQPASPPITPTNNQPTSVAAPQVAAATGPDNSSSSPSTSTEAHVQSGATRGTTTTATADSTPVAPINAVAQTVPAVQAGGAAGETQPAPDQPASSGAHC